MPVGYTSALEHVFTGPGCSDAGAVGADWCDRAKCSFICLFLPHSLIFHPLICYFFHSILIIAYFGKKKLFFFNNS